MIFNYILVYRLIFVSANQQHILSISKTTEIIMMLHKHVLEYYLSWSKSTIVRPTKFFI